ncbi:hypothetical protein ABQX22_13720 [Xanthomonas sp. WHRI 1810A]|uniref:hypothetical protein n=1 Tax=Xanthomonas sp. WHRI 1810A TaxID=3161565 RepID=UPI0032E92F3C
MSKTLHGSLAIKVGEETFDLSVTLGAVRKIEAHFGGLRGAAEAMRVLSVDGVALVIAAGAGLGAKDAELLPEKVWQAGVSDLAVQLTGYLGALYNPRGATPENVEAGKG